MNDRVSMSRAAACYSTSCLLSWMKKRSKTPGRRASDSCWAKWLPSNGQHFVCACSSLPFLVNNITIITISLSSLLAVVVVATGTLIHPNRIATPIVDACDFMFTYLAPDLLSTMAVSYQSVKQGASLAARKCHDFQNNSKLFQQSDVDRP
jgi:hypothetical protein